MIQLSNVDAEKVCQYLAELYCSKKGNKANTRVINEARMLGLLLRKINKKLDKVIPERNKAYVK